MAYWSLGLLLLSLIFLAYRHPQVVMDQLPGWLRRVYSRPPGIPQHHDGGTAESNGSPSSDRRKAGADTDEASDGDSTPKAPPTERQDTVPTFSLNENTGLDQVRTTPPEPTVPSFPAANSAQRASAASQPARNSSSGLMPPPIRPSSLPRTPANSLRTPTTGPLPNRGPPAASQQRVSSSLAATGTVTTPNARGKVLLSPGHSPLDWAALTRSGNISGVSGFQRVTPSQLRAMTGRRGKPAWSSWQGKVYNITPYLPFHPGGEAELMKAAGRDGAKLFMEVHPWVNWESMLGACLVGVVVPEGYGEADVGKEGGSLEDVD